MTNLRSKELKEIYSNWNILKFEEYVDEEGNEMNYIVAQKP